MIPTIKIIRNKTYIECINDNNHNNDDECKPKNRIKINIDNL